MVSFSLNKSVFICFFSMHFLSPSSILFSWHLSYQFVGCLFVILYCSMLLLVYFSNEFIANRKRRAHRGSAKKCSTQPPTGILKLQVVVCHHAIFVWLLFCSSKIAVFTVSKELFDVASYMTLLRRYITFTTTFQLCKVLGLGLKGTLRGNPQKGRRVLWENHRQAIKHMYCLWQERFFLNRVLSRQ